MPFPLLSLLPIIGAGLSGYAGAKLAGAGSSNSPMPQQRRTGSGVNSQNLPSQGNFWSGSPSQIHQLPKFSQQQIGTLDQLRQMGLGGLQGNKFDFAPVEQQARQDFERKTIPSIAQRFSNVGGIGSGAYGRQLGQAGQDLETNLAGMRQGYNLNQQDFYKNLLGLGLQPQFDTKIEAASPGLSQSLGGGLAESLAKSAPGLFQLLGKLGYFGEAIKGAL